MKRNAGALLPLLMSQNHKATHFLSNPLLRSNHCVAQVDRKKMKGWQAYKWLQIFQKYRLLDPYCIHVTVWEQEMSLYLSLSCFTTEQIFSRASVFQISSGFSWFAEKERREIETVWTRIQRSFLRYSNTKHFLAWQQRKAIAAWQ